MTTKGNEFLIAKYNKANEDNKEMIELLKEAKEEIRDLKVCGCNAWETFFKERIEHLKFKTEVISNLIESDNTECISTFRESKDGTIEEVKVEQMLADLKEEIDFITNTELPKLRDMRGRI